MTVEPIGTKLKMLRTERNVSQEEVASSCDISRVALTRYENSVRMPTLDIAVRLAAYYGLTIEELYGIQPEPIESKKESAGIGKLSEDEIELIKNFRQCNRENQSRVIAYAEGAAGAPGH